MTTPGPAGPQAKRSRRMIAALVIAIAVWGIFLAIGATGIFTDFGLFDSRRAIIVLLCSTMFLGSWLGVLAYRSRSPSDTTADETRINWSSILSLAASFTAFALWIAAHLVWSEGTRLTTVLGWTAAALFGASAIMALIGASDPRDSRGKLLALVTLLLLLMAIALFVWQVKRYTVKRSSVGRMPLLLSLTDSDYFWKHDFRSDETLSSVIPTWQISPNPAALD